MLERVINKKDQDILKKGKKFKNKSFEQLSKKEKDELLKIIAEKLNLI